jgi:hypothetical protein
MITKTITDTKDIVRDMKRMQMIYIQNIGDVLWEESQLVMNMSLDQCPVEFGKLRASGRVDEPEYSYNKTSIRMGYSTEYAIYVHENLQARHLAPTKAKFLEDPVDFYKWGFAERVGRRLQAMITEAMAV